ncbi:MAG: choice-of-anchor D domain-containing protein [Aliifodinibius sp.]|nr:choice-of-anchor D domain-containing protein [candidate division KSB1 bacterium]NIT61788.1 choice-of-anchor D domain-containing protein [Fodinibius sp.]NIS28091.1 choice-of-anchor D domain-containing protein [candidate division KSB1 bacterium]NIU28771.1 choice-of-anchor D domain-containing protein [candidate division KSB1 bacterium]NIU92947.1 choice-of-anchor D domain-containing protein [candidate division KSB1 bacterium]
MLPFNPSFRRLVLQNIPQLSSEDLDRHENLIALRLHEQQEINLVTTGEPDIQVEPVAHGFGSVSVGKSKFVSLQVKNTGTAILKVTELVLTGDSDQFNIENRATSFTVRPARSHRIVVRFTPTSEGEKNATLKIKSNVTGVTQVSLTGTGVESEVPDIEVEPASHDYGEVIVENSASQTFTIKNEGMAELSVEKIELRGEYEQEFALESRETPFKLAPDDSQDIFVAFRPACEGTREATLVITSNDPDEKEFEVPLSGLGVSDVEFPTYHAAKTRSSYGALNFREELIEQATEEANAILAPYRAAYKATVRRYYARRRVALAGGNYLQIPSTFRGLLALIWAIIVYRWVQIETFPTLAANRLRYFIENITRGQVIAIVVGVFLISMGLLALEPKAPTEQPAPTEIQPAHPDSVITEKR